MRHAKREERYWRDLAEAQKDEAVSGTVQRWMSQRGHVSLEVLSHYQELLKETGGACQICGNKPEGRLCRDHNHRTGEPRGLLCYSCNVRLSLVDNHRAEVIAYLRRFKAGWWKNRKRERKR